MIVYGDRTRESTTRAELAALIEAARGCERSPDAADALLVEAGAFVQGICDLEFNATGRDSDGVIQRELHALVCDVARVRERSASADTVLDRLRALARTLVDRRLVLRVPEGYAHYALHPDQYASASRELAPHVRARLRIIGLRSIGTSLGAVVHAGSGTRERLFTVRPDGHPFRRELRVDERLEAALLAGAESVHFAIVDEGPGLSGSSLGCVGDWLERRGIPSDRVHVFPAHRNPPGAHADPRHRERWGRALLHVAKAATPAWLAVDGAQDLSGGKWRERLAPSVPWPPANRAHERHKILLPDGRIARFAGLGRIGEAKAAIAARLGIEGLVPRFHRLERGFLLEDWIGDATPLHAATGLDPIAAVSRYLVARAPLRSAFDSPSLASLLEMAAFNTRLALGDAAADRVLQFAPHLHEIESRRRPIAIDGRLHAWEWLVRPDGSLLKADAVDHHVAHDCIGAQDLAWDLAGANVELGLGAELVDRVERGTGRRWTADALRFHRVAYLAFQCGAFTLSRDALQPIDEAEAARHDRERSRYARRLAEELSGRAS